MELKNITLKEYVELDDKKEYEFALKYSKEFKKSNDYFKLGDFNELKFGFVKDAQYYLSNGMTYDRYASMISEQKNIKNIGNTHILDFFQSFNYFQEQIKQISDIEMVALASKNTSKEQEEMEAAGIEMFEVFGVYLQIRSIAIALNTTIEQVRNMKYSDAFVELAYQKTDFQFKKNLNYIRSKNND